MGEVSRKVLIDKGVIQGLRGLFDETSQAQAFLNDLIVTFDDAGAETAAELRETLANGDFPGVSQLAHKLKGLSRNIGALHLGQSCARLEVDATRLPPPDVERLCSTVLAEFNASLAELRDSYFLQ